MGVTMELNLKNLRQSTKLNQTEYGKLFNLTQGTYSNYENGTTQPDLQILVKIADFHKVSLDYVIGRFFANEFGYMADDEKLLVNTYRKLNHYNQAKLIGEANGMLLTQD